jgi:hypothetical protein
MSLISTNLNSSTGLTNPLSKSTMGASSNTLAMPSIDNLPIQQHNKMSFYVFIYDACLWDIFFNLNPHTTTPPSAFLEIVIIFSFFVGFRWKK